MKAAVPPIFWAWATTCRAMVVLPEDSGPKTSMIRPRGMPPTPRAISRSMQPVGMAEMFRLAELSPSFMMAPLPNCFSICARAISRAFSLSSIAIPSFSFLSLILP